MDASRAAHRAIIQRIADEGQLADGWTVETAGGLSYTVTMNGPWRELTRALGWTPKEYAENMTRLLRLSFLTERLPGGDVPTRRRRCERSQAHHQRGRWLVAHSRRLCRGFATDDCDVIHRTWRHHYDDGGLHHHDVVVSRR